ncbi:hypothetical protein [Nocardia xishanensis]|uniref:hypothetical protein n=1 Tax=Nocardia xishanensis TaxID=238964 RepID=UPI00343B4D42
MCARRLLEGDRREDRVVARRCGAVGDDHEFVVVIVESVDDGDTAALGVLQRFVGAEVVGVEFRAVRCEGAGDIALVHLVDEPASRMPAAERAIETQCDASVQKGPGQTQRHGVGVRGDVHAATLGRVAVRSPDPPLVKFAEELRFGIRPVTVQSIVRSNQEIQAVTGRSECGTGL